ncbi:MarR family transcriptional regulator [Rhodobacter sp. NTK016B]|uniref:MarR family winged helix-turn-helix transcriptional regulator n=1 Tax=Rhodobacter sp. NTK016B TaxID=2759676 RepID=UPI001A8F68DF|nr:MarR family transcriptional regulator [Rhodobacter sp. NTK016B]MBN8292915.1 MarR family transcriptional regulator [Rhodobacter sp. NTK016B]
MTRDQSRAAPTGPDDGSNLPTLDRDGHSVLDLDGYIPFLISAVGNKWSRSSSGLYLKEFGIGVTEWRMLAMLAIEPRITAYRMCQVIGLDKAAASRGLKAMEARGLVRSWQEDPQNHRKLIELTDAGWVLHDRIIVVARRREALMLADLSRDEVATLASLLRRMHKRIPDLLAIDSQDF